MIKRFLPRSLLGRSLLIIVTPLVLLQVVSALIFFESHWNKVSLRLARGLAGDIASLVDVMDENPGPENRKWIFDLAARNMGNVAALQQFETDAPTTPVAAARSAPTPITPMANPPRKRPKRRPIVSNKSSAKSDFSRTVPMKMKNGTASSV